MEARTVKRREQFNDAGDRFEPFSMKREVRNKKQGWILQAKTRA
jgi:hypothetical protein